MTNVYWGVLLGISCVLAHSNAPKNRYSYSIIFHLIARAHRIGMLRKC